MQINNVVHCVKSVPYSEFFWPVFSRIRTEYEIPHSVRMRENTDQKNSECGDFSRSGRYAFTSK